MWVNQIIINKSIILEKEGSQNGESLKIFSCFEKERKKIIFIKGLLNDVK